MGSQAQANPFRWSTKWWDDETTLVYYGYRFYSPRLGRFINRDPIEEKGGINLYAFVANNPAGHWDNLGQDLWTPSAAANEIMYAAKQVYNNLRDGIGWGSAFLEQTDNLSPYDALNKSFEEFRKIQEEQEPPPSNPKKPTTDEPDKDPQSGDKLAGGAPTKEAKDSGDDSATNNANNPGYYEEKPASNWTISDKGVKLIQKFETFSGKVYDANKGKGKRDWTIGWGHKLTKSEVSAWQSGEIFSKGISEKQGDAFLRSDLAKSEAVVRKTIKPALAQFEYDALVSYAFNIGEGAFANTSRVVRLINAGEYVAALNLWGESFVTSRGNPDPSAGLHARREAEANLFGLAEY